MLSLATIGRSIFQLPIPTNGRTCSPVSRAWHSRGFAFIGDNSIYEGHEGSRNVKETCVDPGYALFPWDAS